MVVSRITNSRVYNVQVWLAAMNLRADKNIALIIILLLFLLFKLIEQRHIFSVNNREFK